MPAVIYEPAYEGWYCYVSTNEEVWGWGKTKEAALEDLKTTLNITVALLNALNSQ